jgi:hypothetical protein
MQQGDRRWTPDRIFVDDHGHTACRLPCQKRNQLVASKASIGYLAGLRVELR